MSQRTQSMTERSRPGFTLTELLVVMFIIAVIAGLAVIFMPGFDESERASQGASDLHGWLLLARQSALRDQAPRGVRLFPDPNNPGLYNKGQYLEQPDDFTGGTVKSTVGAGPIGLNNVTITPDPTSGAGDPTGGFGVADSTLWPVQVGDSIQFHNSGLMHQITAIAPDLTAPGSYRLTLFQVGAATALQFPITQPQSNYKIVRQPRLVGDEPMEMPVSAGIDITTNTTYGVQPVPSAPGAPIDVMFAPNGSVIFSTSTDKLIFWIRNSELPLTAANGTFTNGQTLIVVYVQSGFVSSYDVAQVQANPYFNVK